MDRLNELVNGSPSLQRLRDVACQLMLPNRQQEELANYVNAFINNFSFYGGIRYWQNSVTQNYKWLDWREFDKAQPNIKPYIKQVFVSQGCYSSMEAQGAAGGVIVNPLRGFAILDFVKMFPDGIPANAFWFGFVSPVYARGNVRTSETGGDLKYYSKALTPYTIASSVGAWDVFSEFRKLTDTSPLVSKNGLIYVDFSEGLDVPQKELALTPTFSVSFNYVGMIVVFGGETKGRVESVPDPEPNPDPSVPSIDVFDAAYMLNLIAKLQKDEDLTQFEQEYFVKWHEEAGIELPSPVPPTD